MDARDLNLSIMSARKSRSALASSDPKRPLAWARGRWVGYEDGYGREKQITIKRNGTLVSRNKVFDDGTQVYEDRIVIKPHSDKRGVLTFHHKNGAKKGIQGKATIGRNRLEARGPGFSVKVYLEGDQLVFDQEGEKLYGDLDRRVLKMSRAAKSQGASNVSTGHQHDPMQPTPPRVFPNGEQVLDAERQHVIDVAEAGVVHSFVRPPAPTAPWP
jgi:hypothetical protein